MVDHMLSNSQIMADCISSNRQHIKPTTVTITADTYLQDQSNKLSNNTTDPLAEILNNINRNPAIYTTEWAMTINNTCDRYDDSKHQ